MAWIGFVVLGVGVVVLIVAVVVIANAVATNDAEKLLAAHERYHQRLNEAHMAAIIRAFDNLEGDDDGDE